MLTFQRLLRSRPEWDSGTMQIFWYMMDEHIHFWCHPGNMCSHGSHQLFLKCVYIIFEFWIQDVTENRNTKQNIPDNLVLRKWWKAETRKYFFQTFGELKVNSDL